MAKVFGYGELLMRMTPSSHGQLILNTDEMAISFAGAEANVLADLVRWGHRCSFVSSLPKNVLGDKACHFLQRHGIQIEHVHRDHHRMGTYYIEHGKSIRGGKVIYDRKGSSVSHYLLDHSLWEVITDQADYLVLSGITPALSDDCRNNIKYALSLAKSKKVKVVFDLNYRRSLWKPNIAKTFFTQILPMVDILIANVGSAMDIFGIGEDYPQDYEEMVHRSSRTAKVLWELGEFDLIGMTVRHQINADSHLLGGLLYNKNDSFKSRTIPTQILDRLGGGDAFVAGLIHGIIHQMEYDECINFATAAFATTQTIEGDINLLSEADIAEIAKGDLQGFVKR